MDNRQGGTNSYAVDFVMCIDGTGSMDGMINKVKANAIDMYARFLVAMESAGKAIRDDWFRVKVIVFRDYKVDGEIAMQESEFFEMNTPEGRSAFERFVQGIEADGGGDTPENALEAIYEAIKSDWVTVGGRFRRHAIVLFTDAPALPLQDPDRASQPNYPLDAPADLNALKDLIDNFEGQDMSYSGKRGRVVVFAPEGCGWDWVRTLNYGYLLPTQPDGGCEEVDFDQALAVVASSF